MAHDMNITNIHATELLDSKNHPTIQTTVTLTDGSTHTAASPSGASTGTTEAIELPVNQAIRQIQETLTPALLGKSVDDGQKELDDIIVALDGTENKHVIGGNATTSLSMALVKAGAHARHIPLYAYIQQLTQTKRCELPVPLFLVMEGGKHGNWATDIQEFMIIPNAQFYRTFAQRLDACTKVFDTLEAILKEKHYALTIGFEGAFCPQELTSNEEALTLIVKAIECAGLTPGKHMDIAIDAAASEFYRDGSYVLQSEDGKKLTPSEWMQQIVTWSQTYPIRSLEDMFDQEDWSNWQTLMQKLGDNHMIVGDDLVTTNVKRIQKAIDQNAINSLIIKVNQIGTITETVNAIALGRSAGFSTIISHRGGETHDDTIADLAVGTASYCKFGGPRHGERMVKYRRLLAIEKELTTN